MRTTIDPAGRLVVPKKLRERLLPDEGGVVDVIERDGVIEIRPVTAEVELEERPGGPVARSPHAMPPLTDDDVRDVLERVRES